MGMISRVFKRISSFFSKIHLVDRCLLVFMVILLLQSAYSLFGLPISSGEGHTIDVIVRTSISAIFGYFLSVNFIQNESQKGNKKGKAKVSAMSVGDVKDAEPEKNETGNPSTNRLQILVATSIGLFCLIALILVRDMFPAKILNSSASSFAATVSQFRDLVSGCVGFLIGCPNTSKNDKSNT